MIVLAEKYTSNAEGEKIILLLTTIDTTWLISWFQPQKKKLVRTLKKTFSLIQTIPSLHCFVLLCKNIIHFTTNIFFAIINGWYLSSMDGYYLKALLTRISIFEDTLMPLLFNKELLFWDKSEKWWAFFMLCTEKRPRPFRITTQ